MNLLSASQSLILNTIQGAALVGLESMNSADYVLTEFDFAQNEIRIAFADSALSQLVVSVYHDVPGDVKSSVSLTTHNRTRLWLATAYCHVVTSYPFNNDILPLISIIPALQIVNHMIWPVCVRNNCDEIRISPAKSAFIDLQVENSAFFLSLETDKGTRYCSTKEYRDSAGTLEAENEIIYDAASLSEMSLPLRFSSSKLTSSSSRVTFQRDSSDFTVAPIMHFMHTVIIRNLTKLSLLLKFDGDSVITVDAGAQVAPQREVNRVSLSHDGCAVISFI